MAAQLQNFDPQPQVVGALTTEGYICTFVSTPSSSILLRWISNDDFAQSRGQALLESLSDAVENILQDGMAADATGVQTIESSGFLADNVDFAVRYVPSQPILGTLTASVRIPVPVLVADTSFGSFLTGGSAPDRISAAYNQLRTLAGG